MLDLKDVSYFVQVVNRGGFTSAGRSLRLPKSTLSHRVRELEVSLGVRLLRRTSRHFGMTDVGAEFYQHALTLLKSAEDAEEAVRQRSSESSGVIRITTAVEIAQFALRDLLPVFLNRHPKVQIIEIATDRLVDIVGEGFDLAIRGHSAPLQDSTLVQRSIASVPWYLFAGAKYLEHSGVPDSPQELARHATISMVRSGPPHWRLRGPEGGEVDMPLEPRFQSNNIIAIKEAACANLGIAALPGYICREELQAGALQQVLPDWVVEDARISALMPYRTGLLPAVRSLVDFLAIEIPAVTAYDPVRRELPRVASAIVQFPGRYVPEAADRERSQSTYRFAGQRPQ